MDRAGERGNTAITGGIERDLKNIVRQAGITGDQLKTLYPFFDTLIANIHSKWENLSVDDGAGAKLLKFQLLTVKELRRAMEKVVNDGKKAAKKLGDNADGR